MKKISYFISNKNILLVFILLIGLALRLYQLGKLDFWIDEVWSICFTRGLDLIGDMHPPLYYAMLKFWIKIFGETEFKIRLLSALFSFFTIFIIFKLGKLMFNYKVGLISAFILSLSPIHIWYSQEARQYSLSVFLSMLMVYFFFPNY